MTTPVTLYAFAPSAEDEKSMEKVNNNVNPESSFVVINATDADENYESPFAYAMRTQQFTTNNVTTSPKPSAPTEEEFYDTIIEDPFEDFVVVSDSYLDGDGDDDDDDDVSAMQYHHFIRKSTGNSLFFTQMLRSGLNKIRNTFYFSRNYEANQQRDDNEWIWRNRGTFSYNQDSNNSSSFMSIPPGPLIVVGDPIIEGPEILRPTVQGRNDITPRSPSSGTLQHQNNNIALQFMNQIQQSSWDLVGSTTQQVIQLAAGVEQRLNVVESARDGVIYGYIYLLRQQRRLQRRLFHADEDGDNGNGNDDSAAAIELTS